MEKEYTSLFMKHSPKNHSGAIYRMASGLALYLGSLNRGVPNLRSCPGSVNTLASPKSPRRAWPSRVMRMLF